MKRLLLIRVTTPAVLLGSALLVACLVGAWSVNRMNGHVDAALSQSANSVRAAHHLEIQVNRLRAHLLMYLAHPAPDLAERIDADQAAFEHWYAVAEQTAYTTGEREAVDRIWAAYARFREAVRQARDGTGRDGGTDAVVAFAARASVREVVGPCEEYGRLNEEQLAEAVADNKRVGGRLQFVLLALGVAGPLGGLMSGYALARRLRESVTRLSVRVRDMTRSLDADAGEVLLMADGDLAHLDRQLHAVTEKVAGVIDRLQRQEREMLRAEQLAAVGHLAAGIAHEVRNPLTAIKILIQAAVHPAHPKPLTSESLRVIHEEVLRLERTVQGLLDFTRPPALWKEPCDLGKVVGRAAALVEVRARQQKVRVVLDLPSDPLVVPADPGQLTSVAVNLLLNALDAMPGGGALSVRLTSGSTAATLTVADTGPGIPEDVQSRLFTPFVSTKPTGTGLGLSICKRVVEEHGGTIAADSPPAGGAVFTVTLPPPGGEATRADAAGN